MLLVTQTHLLQVSLRGLQVMQVMQVMQIGMNRDAYNNKNKYVYVYNK